MSTDRMHWLKRIAIRAGLPGAERIELDVALPLEQAWEGVSKGCGIDPAALARQVARVLALPLADLDHVQKRALKLLPEPVSRRHQVLALREDHQRLYVATADPLDLEAEQAVAFASGRRPVFEVAPPAALREAIDFYFSTDDAVDKLLHNIDDELRADLALVGDKSDRVIPIGGTDGGSIIQLTNYLLRDAIRQRASDIHMEPGPSVASIRYRIDGVVHPVLRIPLLALQRVISRLKVLAQMDIADRLRPQDGHLRVQADGQPYDLRISTVPTREAEKAVVRILAPVSSTRLKDLAFPPREQALLQELLGHRNGIVIVTGPTGSGKTTTLYAAISELASGQVNVMTVEDPVEYQLPGITQIQVDTRKGVTFASALRAILRQDPDIIFVGEIRDLETATVAVQASMTGHLVLATLHTNDAASAIARLGDLGLDHASIASTLRGVIAQRLLRVLCPHCAAPVSEPLTPEEERLAAQYHTRPVRRAVGCARCASSGYLGRVPVAEVLVMTPQLLERVQARESVAEIERAAVSSGHLRRLATGGLERVRAGETTLEEFERVLGAGPEEGTAEQPRRVHILVADDDLENRILARALLEANGYQVSEAADGQAAVEFLSSSAAVDLLVLDLEMPRLSGREVLARVRRETRTAALPVVVLTGVQGGAVEVQLMDEGADDYIHKPLDPDLFLARIRAALRRAGR
jgi:type IV pilus assembly protein PilB